MRKMLCVSIVVCLVGGCAATPRGKTFSYKGGYHRNQERLHQSLFPGDTSTLSNEAIERVLNGKVALPEHCRLGVISLGAQQRWSHPSERLVALDRQAVSGFVAKLGKADRIDDVLLMPALLVPQKPTVPKLREMAARCQADMVFIYTVGHESYRRSKFLTADQMHGYCHVEGVLLDTRTGIVALTASSVQDFVTKESREDMDFSETIRRSEIEATSLALEEIAVKLVSFLNAADQ